MSGELTTIALWETLNRWTDTWRTKIDERPKGKTLRLVGTGSTAFPQNQDQSLLQHRSAEARQWTVHLYAEQLQGGLGYPRARFLVRTATDGQTEEYEVDAFGDCNLSVWAQEITVSAGWDREFELGFPTSIVLFASLAEARSHGTARRTRLVDGSVAGVKIVTIPRGSRGVMVRTASVAYGASIGALRYLSNALPIDALTAAEVSAAHGRGEYLQIPTNANRVELTITAAAAELVTVEFEIRP